MVDSEVPEYQLSIPEVMQAYELHLYHALSSS